ncbi:MAG: hypothetical protein M3133_04100 [Actinomycetota bacterium]|nr:hypothetical protein [Actinomycetota bacterium]
MAVAITGLVGVTAVYLPWYELDASVTLLGHTQAGSLARLPGWQAQPWIWLVAAASLTVMGVGLAVALDRQPPSTRRTLFALALTVAVLAGLSALLDPPPTRFLAEGRIDELEAAAGRMPEDVSLRLIVRPGSGLWLTLIEAALLMAGAFTTREG